MTRQAASFGIAFAALSATTVLLTRQAAETPAARLSAAGRYVGAHARAFTSMAGQEHQVQRLLNAKGETKRQRDLVSEILIVNTGSRYPVLYRNAVAVDGKPVRKRDERLQKLTTSAHGPSAVASGRTFAGTFAR